VQEGIFSFYLLSVTESQKHNLNKTHNWPKNAQNNELGTLFGQSLEYILALMRLSRLGTKVKPASKYSSKYYY